jgi:hypothetical protein
MSLCSAVTAQDVERFTQGNLAGFTKSPTEHIIVEIREPFVVRSVRGTISFEGREDPLAQVLFEMRGLHDEKVRAAVCDQSGRFRIHSVPAGTYQFKATRNGFQSVVGTIIVTKHAPKDSALKLTMRVGV